MWTNGVGTVCILVTRVVSFTLVKVYEITDKKNAISKLCKKRRAQAITFGRIARTRDYRTWGKKVIYVKKLSFGNLKNENITCHLIKIKINKQLTNQTKIHYTNQQDSRGFWDHWRLPVQFNPSPIYPGLHVHTYDPCVLLHAASLWHLPRVPSHSSISVVKW